MNFITKQFHSQFTIMNREIKFRAWVKTPEIIGMFYPNETAINSPIGIAFQHNIGYINQRPEKIVIDDWQKEIAFMQFTGLYDKNGKEIYEGDLIHRHMNVYWKVVFKESKWIADSLKGSALFLDANQFIEAEIVGNVYENPELIPNL